MGLRTPTPFYNGAHAARIPRYVDPNLCMRRHPAESGAVVVQSNANSYMYTASETAQKSRARPGLRAFCDTIVDTFAIKGGARSVRFETIFKSWQRPNTTICAIFAAVPSPSVTVSDLACPIPLRTEDIQDAANRAIVANLGQRINEILVALPVPRVHLDGGAFDDEYLVNITVGGKPFQVILDTGSADTWCAHEGFTCRDLNGTVVPPETCNFGPALFEPTKSTTFQLFPDVTFLIRYGSGEFLSGPVGFETVAVGGLSVAQQEIGVPDRNAFLGDGVSEGILGLAFPELRVWNTTDPNNASQLNHIPYSPFFVNAVAQKAVTKPYFSVALNRPTFNHWQQANDPFDPNLGLLAFGGIAQRDCSCSIYAVVWNGRHPSSDITSWTA
ncbi:aspartic peptidase domain-containing protein [Mycena leptocephala]|nr:aspartic peptidase domain-containing protein [Mycena leptocephala]